MDVVIGAAVVTLAVLTAARWVDGASLGLAIVQSLMWPLVLGSVLVAALAAVTRRRVVGAAAGLLVMVQAGLAVPWFLADHPPSPGSATLTVISSNIQFGQADLDVLDRQVSTRRADVLVLLEVTPQAQAALRTSALSTALPFQAGQGQPGATGTMVLSRWPLTELDPGSASAFLQPVVEVAAPTGPVLLRAVHPAPPTMTERWYGELSDLVAWTVGTREVEQRPLVLAGDLNAGDGHPIFRRLTEVTVDAHEAVGAAVVRTWPTEGWVPAFTQLDHILVRGLGVQAAGTFAVPGTDHAAVWATLTVPAPAD